MRTMTAALLAILLQAIPAKAESPAPPVLDEIKRIARQAEPRCKTPWVKDFIKAAQQLPPVGNRRFFHTADKSAYFTEEEAAKLPKVERAALTAREVDEEIYYARITDPLGYLRPMEVLAAAGFQPAGKRLVDFGYGNIGQLKMLASIGADALGIEVDPLLPKLYARDVGPLGSGRVRVLHGYFPTDPKLVEAIGRGYDLFLSKNTLKRGYVRPAVPVEPKKRIDLGSDQAFLAAVRDTPAPAAPGKPYVQMGDIRCPFEKATLERAGFEVLAYDVDDNREGRAVAKLLEWDKGPDAMELEHGLFAMYTLARRK